MILPEHYYTIHQICVAKRKLNIKGKQTLKCLILGIPTYTVIHVVLKPYKFKAFRITDIVLGFSSSPGSYTIGLKALKSKIFKVMNQQSNSISILKS